MRPIPTSWPRLNAPRLSVWLRRPGWALATAARSSASGSAAAAARPAPRAARAPPQLRHTFATWLDDAIPSQVIDELMGHASGRRDRGAGGGRVYRETTPAMVARVTAALDDRIGHALAVAAYVLRERRDWRAVDGGEASDLGWS